MTDLGVQQQRQSQHPIKKVLHINTVTTYCAQKIATQTPILLILDIDDTVLSSCPGQRLVEPHIRYLLELAHTNPHLCKYLFCTARDATHRKLTLDQLNHAKLIHVGDFIPYKVLHSPYVTVSGPTPRPTKGNALLSYLRGAEIDPEAIHIVVVDDDNEQIAHIHEYLRQSEYAGKYTLWYYIASWAQQNQCWVEPLPFATPALPSTAETAAP